MEYKLYGQIKRKCNKNGHMIIRYADAEDDLCYTRDKLERIHNDMIAVRDPGKTYSGLVIPKFDNDEPEEEKKHVDMRCPYTSVEYVVKVPRKMIGSLPEEGTFITLWVHPTKYKFEKDNHKYNGWNIILKKLSSRIYS